MSRMQKRKIQKQPIISFYALFSQFVIVECGSYTKEICKSFMTYQDMTKELLLLLEQEFFRKDNSKRYGRKETRNMKIKAVMSYDRQWTCLQERYKISAIRLCGFSG